MNTRQLVVEVSPELWENVKKHAAGQEQDWLLRAIIARIIEDDETKRAGNKANEPVKGVAA